ncbi:unnamed protein product, partial [Phaeothamnion confervicola]
GGGGGSGDGGCSHGGGSRANEAGGLLDGGGAVGGMRCGKCQQYAYMEVVICEACSSTKGLGVRRLACGEHLAHLCSCSKDNYTVFVRAEPDELAAHLMALAAVAARLGGDLEASAAAVSADTLRYKRTRSYDLGGSGGRAASESGKAGGKANAAAAAAGGGRRGKRNVEKPESAAEPSEAAARLLEAWLERPTAEEATDLLLLCEQQKAAPHLLRGLREAGAVAGAWGALVSGIVAACGAGRSSGPVSKTEDIEVDPGHVPPATAVAPEAQDSDQVRRSDRSRGARQTRQTRGAADAEAGTAAAAETASADTTAKAPSKAAAVAPKKSRAGAAAATPLRAKDSPVPFGDAVSFLLEGLHLPVRVPDTVAALAAAVAEASALRKRSRDLLGLAAPSDAPFLAPMLSQLQFAAHATLPVAPMVVVAAESASPMATAAPAITGDAPAAVHLRRPAPMVAAAAAPAVAAAATAAAAAVASAASAVVVAGAAAATTGFGGGGGGGGGGDNS